MTALNLPAEVLKALRGHKAGPGKVLGHDGARPFWTTPTSGLFIVSATEPASPATGQAWLDTGVTYVTNVDWIRYKTYTVPSAAGSRTITFDTPVTLSPGVDYWYVLQNIAANAQRDPTVTRVGISSPDGSQARYSASGSDFSSVYAGSAYMLFTLEEASGGTDKSITQAVPGDYWGVTSIGQKFQVDATISVGGLTAYWGGNAGLSGNWGLARSVNASTHPLRVWDGTDWQTAAALPPA